MITVEITKPLGITLFDGCFSRNDFDTKEQKKNADGVPMWSISCVLRQPDARRSETLTVNVPSAKDPNEVFSPFDPVAFDGLRIMTGENDGKTWVSYSADAMRPANAAAPKSDTPAK